MNPNQVTTLDPKLREAYERVMGTVVAPRPPLSKANTPPAVPADQLQAASDAPLPEMLAQYATSNASSTPPSSASIVNQVPLTPPIKSQETNIEKPFFPTSDPQPQPTSPASTLSSLDTTSSTQMHAYVAEQVAGVKQSLKLIQLVYVAGGIIFIAVYALFWMRFFKIALPF